MDLTPERKGDGGTGGGVTPILQDSWEARAVELFTLCDRECKGFVTKRDLQRLWGELPLDPDQLEGVFDSLDEDQNGFLSLQEFTDGFGRHLGLLVEFRAEGGSTDLSPEQPQLTKVNEDVTGITPEQLDLILNKLSKQDLDTNSAVVGAVWQEVCGLSEEAAEGGVGLEVLVAALLQELSRVRQEHAHLEATLAFKNEQYNQQVAKLYEELEVQLSGETSKADKEQLERGARALTTLEAEVHEREAALRALQEEHTALQQRLEEVVEAELQARQHNTHLSQHLDKLEDELARRESEVRDLTSALDTFKKNTKNEKRRRVDQALRVSEGIARERESLVTQLDMLRTINTQLRDEQDQVSAPIHTPRSRDNEGKTSSLSSPASSSTSVSTVAAPVSDQEGASATEPPPGGTDTNDSVSDTVFPKARPRTLALTQTTHLQPHSLQEVAQGVLGSSSGSDFEHDDEYFKEVRKQAKADLMLRTLASSPPPENSLLQEILAQSPLCVVCGGSLHSTNSSKEKSQGRPCSQRKESMTQTSPMESVPSAMLHRSSSVQTSGYSSISNETTQDSEEGLIAHVEVCANCVCKRRDSELSTLSQHSSTIIIHHQPDPSSHPDLLVQPHPVHHTYHTHQTKHIHHTYFTLQSCKQSPDLIESETQTEESSAETDNDAVKNLDPQPTQVTSNQDKRCPYCQISAGQITLNEGVIEDRICMNMNGSSQCNDRGTGDALLKDSQTTEKIKVNGVPQEEEEEEEEEPKRPLPAKRSLYQLLEDDKGDNQKRITDGTTLNTTGENTSSNTTDNKTTRDATDGGGMKYADAGEVTLNVTKDNGVTQSSNDTQITSNGHFTDTKNGDIESPKLIFEGIQGKHKERNKQTRTEEKNNTTVQPDMEEIPSDASLTPRMFKIVFLGDSGVGKTSFIHRACTGEFRKNFGSTVGVDYQVMEVCVGGIRAVLQLWDTAGQERFRSITRQYYRKADGVIIMYDVTCEQSFLSVKDWISSVKESAGNDIVVAVLGNKGDLQSARMIKKDTANKMATSHKCLLYECSAMTGRGVLEAMKHIAALLTTQQDDDIAGSFGLTLQPAHKAKKCC